jgi:Fe-S cluster biogenesis protein NfuA
MAAAELERQIERIDELVQRLESGVDPATRAAAQELVQTLMDLHGTALERILAMARSRGQAASSLVEEFAQDEIVRNVMLLYGLHPVDIETRVRAALEKTRPYMRSHGGNVELVRIDDDGRVHLHMQGSCQGCPSSAVTLKQAIEQAILETAPDVTSIVVDDGTSAHPPPGLVPLSYNSKAARDGDDVMSVAAAGPP